VPSRKQLQWSELRVGITVLVACITLAALIFLMSSTTGVFTKKIDLKSYFDNAEGLRIGAPVRLQGVDMGNVIGITVVPDKPATPVEVTMKVTDHYHKLLRKDSLAELSTAGVLGETYLDINISQAQGEPANDGDVLRSMNKPDIQDIIRSSQNSLANLDVLVRRLDRIMADVESGKGSAGKLINDPSLFNRLNATLSDLQNVVNKVGHGQGTIGKLVTEDELYNKANATIDKLNKIVDDLQAGKGTAGKLLKDPSLYNNANETIAKTNSLMSDVNQGKGALGKFAKDEEFARKLDQTISNLQVLSERMKNGEGTAGKLFTDPSLFNNADQMLVETRKLVQAIRENPKKYLTVHVRGF